MEAEAEARRILLERQADSLAATPLRDMAAWVAAGAALPAEVLRLAGFVAETPRGDSWMARAAFIAEWGFSIPCAEALRAIVPLSPLVEIGAGSGYWSAILRAAGADIIATDSSPGSDPGYRIKPSRHSHVEALGGMDAVMAYPKRNVFCSWPTRDDDWCAEASAAMQPGRYLALIGYEGGGNTGSAALFDLLENGFDLVARVAIPQWPGMSDALTIHRRKTSN